MSKSDCLEFFNPITSEEYFYTTETWTDAILAMTNEIFENDKETLGVGDASPLEETSADDSDNAVV